MNFSKEIAEGYVQMLEIQHLIERGTKDLVIRKRLKKIGQETRDLYLRAALIDENKALELFESWKRMIRRATKEWDD